MSLLSVVNFLCELKLLTTESVKSYGCCDVMACNSVGNKVLLLYYRKPQVFPKRR